MRRSVQRVLVPLAIAGMVVGGYFVFVRYEMARMAPPAKPCSWETFLANLPPPQEVRVFEVDGREYLEALGPMPNSWLSLPSGPPSYVFDKRGMLVEWTYDRGEVSSDYLGFHASGRSRHLSIDQVPAWFDSGP